MPRPKLSLLSPAEIAQIHDTSLRILKDVGVLVHHKGLTRLLVEAGASLNSLTGRIHYPEQLVLHSLQQAGKQFILYGRDASKTARFGYGDQNLISSPGQYAWFDYHTQVRRDPLLSDARAAGLVGDALDNITIVGGMAVPSDVAPQIQDVILIAELLKCTGKPVRAFPVSQRSARYSLEILKTVAGGEAALRKNPMSEFLFEPISPLQLPDKEIDIMLEFVACGQPINIGPMAMASGTAPATLAGTLAQENAEILAALVAVQVAAPGTPILYGGIPHIMDQRTSICSFGSPEQGLLALGMAEMGKSYGLPVYINVNLTDSKLLDAQAGMEKMGSFILGMLSGADLFGHAGIVGTDHGGCLTWLIVDNEAASFAKRIWRGFEVDEERLGLPVITMVGPGGNYLDQPHTVRHFRKEFWFPGLLWTRLTYDGWFEAGGTSIEARATARVDQILETHTPIPLDPQLVEEIDHIVATCQKELLEPS